MLVMCIFLFLTYLMFFLLRVFPHVYNRDYMQIIIINILNDTFMCVTMLNANKSIVIVIKRRL